MFKFTFCFGVKIELSPNTINNGLGRNKRAVVGLDEKRTREGRKVIRVSWLDIALLVIKITYWLIMINS